MNGDDDSDGAPEADSGDARERGDDAFEADDARERSGATSEADDDASEWRFALSEVGPDGVTEETATPETEPIEPGDINPEHAALVALGVAITVGVFVFGL